MFSSSSSLMKPITPLRVSIFPLVFFFFFLFLIFSSSPSCFISPTQSKIAQLRVSPTTTQHKLVEASKSKEHVDPKYSSSDFGAFYFDQNLDHFTYTPQSYTTFRQRYIVVSKYWGGAETNSPIFAYLGEESSIDSDFAAAGFLRDNAPRFNALQVYIEHRYYGESMPFGSAKEAKHSPIIVFGASYGGMLAAWFRLKYPHIAIGALASSAPLLYFEDTAPKHGYYYIVSKVFKQTSKKCYESIRKSWDEIDREAAKPNGLSILSKNFKTCNRLNGSFALKDYLDSIYAEAVQYNWPPNSEVTEICKAIEAEPLHGSDLLGRIFAGIVAYKGNRSCYDVYEYYSPTNNNIGWDWQSCSEIVMPTGHDKEDAMFQTTPFNMSSRMKDCENSYGVSPRPHWITTYYGGQDIKLILRRFASNIIFSNGLLDPYSIGGVLEDISDTIVAIKTENGSHCLDISLKDKADPKWLIEQREQELNIIDSWIAKYQKDLRDLTI